MRRTLDIFASSLGLVVLMPVLAMLALLVKLQDSGSILYKAKRVGKNGRVFDLFKFRTMVQNADQMGAAITTAEDSRITIVGRFLRTYKLDELPQLVNVLKGDMSLVGARPEDPWFVDLYTEQQKKVLSYRPGITSPASVRFRNEEALLEGPDWKKQYLDVVLPQKLSMDISYLQNRSVSSDIAVILRTLKLLR